MRDAAAEVRTLPDARLCVAIVARTRLLLRYATDAARCLRRAMAQISVPQMKVRHAPYDAR